MTSCTNSTTPVQASMSRRQRIPRSASYARPCFGLYNLAVQVFVVASMAILFSAVETQAQGTEVSASEVFTIAQQKAIAFTPKATGALSLVGSVFIFASILKRLKSGEEMRQYHRILVMMSIFDFLGSAWFFASSWPMPEGTSNVYAAMGTPTTCTVQGFFLQFNLAVPFYYTFLSINYVLTIRYEWREGHLRSIEPYMHAVAILFPLATAIAAIPLDQYNAAGQWCWIARYPLDCTSTAYATTATPASCERGDNAAIYQWAFFYAPLWALMISALVCMTLVYLHVWRQEKRVSRYLVQTRSGRASFTKSKRVAVQGALYVACFYITWIFGTINRLYQTGTNKNNFALMYLHSFFVPLQGFLNFFVYIRPRFYNQRSTGIADKNWLVRFVCLFDWPCCPRGEVPPKSFHTSRRSGDEPSPEAPPGSKECRSAGSGGTGSQSSKHQSKKAADATYLASTYNDETTNGHSSSSVQEILRAVDVISLRRPNNEDAPTSPILVASPPTPVGQGMHDVLNLSEGEHIKTQEDTDAEGDAEVGGVELMTLANNGHGSNHDTSKHKGAATDITEERLSSRTEQTVAVMSRNTSSNASEDRDNSDEAVAPPISPDGSKHLTSPINMTVTGREPYAANSSHSNTVQSVRNESDLPTDDSEYEDDGETFNSSNANDESRKKRKNTKASNFVEEEDGTKERAGSNGYAAASSTALRFT
eukprot:CAMPEP_0171491810 /NCGR_PEP_ID=MMETSP0958-20121227/4062_1 /TAXON_ID=87120 /ORGANISM="Aurantiochytrium limacinum, Strain ATCCMYA-1381" /LENGTH=706 /DNA_ID=CAMNT_0012025261 /DNA_START=521 /DNA_END=2641 /DNA_ORIENTATION=+